MSAFSNDTRISTPQGNNSRRHRHRASRKQESYIATLSPVTQVQKVLADINNFDGSYHLRNWSAKARKELAPNVTITLELLHNGSYVEVEVPKLAFLVASPVFADHVAGSPEAVLLRFISTEVDLEAVKAIASWLRKICSEKIYTNLPVPLDIKKALQLRRTARTLGMSQYVVDTIEYYILGLCYRIPDVYELVLVSEHTKDLGLVDPMLEALANWVGYLMKYHLVDAKQAGLYAEALTAKKCQRLLDAVCEWKVDMIHSMGWFAVYQKPWK